MYACRNTNHNTYLSAGSKLAQSHLTEMWSSKQCSESPNPTVFCAWWSPLQPPLIMQQRLCTPVHKLFFFCIICFFCGFHSQIANWSNFSSMLLSGLKYCKSLEHFWWYFWPGVPVGAHRYATSFSSSLVSLRKVKANDKKCSSNMDGRDAWN